MSRLKRAGTVFGTSLVLAGLLVYAGRTTVEAQAGPFTAQIQRALNGLGLVPSRILPVAVASGSVLASNGVGVAPVWSATPTLTSLTVGSTLCTGGSAGTPCFAVTAGNGMFGTGAAIVFSNGGVASQAFNYDIGGQFKLISTGNIGFSSGAIGAAIDIDVYRSAAKTLKIDTDGAGGALTSVNIVAPLTLPTGAAATPSLKASSGDIDIAAGSGGNVLLSIGGTDYFRVLSTGIVVNGASQFWSPSDGLFQVRNLAGTGFARLILGTNDATTNGASWNLNAGVWEAKVGSGAAFTTVSALGYQVNGLNRIANVTGDFTTANNTNLQAIPGLTWTLPVTTALVVPFRCVLFYSQATAAVATSFGVQTDTVTPTNFQAGGSMETALGTTAYGDATIANTTATAVVTGTPSATATIFNAYVDGLLENPSNASTTTLTIQVKTSVGADAITIKRGSFCRAF